MANVQESAKFILTANIIDILMGHLNQSLLNALEQIQKRKLAATQDGQILIKDLIIQDKTNSSIPGIYYKGEHHGVDNQDLYKETNPELVQRLLRYMEGLGDQVLEIHNQNQQKNPNFVTRMLMPEAFLYPASTRDNGSRTKGLTPENLTSLIQQLSEIIKKYPQNLHLLFSSIPIELADKTMHNVAIYVQGGEPPKIDVFVKAYSDRRDAYYIGRKLFSLKEDLPFAFPALRNQTQINDQSGIDVQFGCIVLCETSAGSCFYTGIDICGDHIEEVGKNRMQAMIQAARTHGDSDFFPSKATYVVTSNSVDLQPQSEISNMITQADPAHRGARAVLDSDAEVFSDAEIKIINVKSKEFGEDRVIYDYPARAVGNFDPALGNQIQQHNKLMIKLNALRQYRAQRLSETDLVHAEVVKTVIEFMRDEVKGKDNNAMMVFGYTLEKIMQEFPKNIDAVMPILTAMRENIVQKYPEKDRKAALALVDIAYTLIEQDKMENEAVKGEYSSLKFQ